ncbi:MAG: hypothetical protein R6U84_01555 [Candidatus Cloacimonadales bacterium]
MLVKERIINSLIFAIFLIGSTILYYQLGRWVSLGVALEVLAIYLLLQRQIGHELSKSKPADTDQK